jgi:hypothetical protein
MADIHVYHDRLSRETALANPRHIGTCFCRVDGTTRRPSVAKLDLRYLRLRWSCARFCKCRCEPGEHHEIDPELHSVAATDPRATETKMHLQPTEFALDGVSAVVQVPPPSGLVRHHRMKARRLPPFARGTTLVCGAFPLRPPVSVIRPVERPRPMNTDAG